MNAVNPSAPLQFPCGRSMPNRLMLAPMTNCQSHDDGHLSEDEYRWLTMRAQGGFGLTMTCASHVQKIGQGFPGQLGFFEAAHGVGHRRLARGIQAHGSLAVVQLHHAGMRAPSALIGEAPVCPSADEETGARALTTHEVHQLRDDFITAAQRAAEAGYDGVEIHGAHGYILCQFLSPQYNRRTDAYGGSLANRWRLVLEILEGVRAACGSSFLIGLRLSPERFGMQPSECLGLCRRVIDERLVDFLDISLWDVFKPAEGATGGDEKRLLDAFTSLARGDVRLTVAGKIMTAADVRWVLAQGVDFAAIGRAGILHHDFARQVIDDPEFTPRSTPVSRATLSAEGLGEDFIEYMTRWKGFVDEA